MGAVNRVLVVGGGFSGMAAAIQMRKAGMHVELVEIDPKWCTLGAGITVNGPTLRALETIGVYGEFVRLGFVSDGVELYSADGNKIVDVPTPRPVGSTVSGGGAIMRPVLAEILAQAARAAGVHVRLGCTWSALKPTTDGVVAEFTDGTNDRYDLVIGADGVHSKLRALLFPEVKPLEYIGQGVWRAVMPRDESIVRPKMWLEKLIKLGVNPVSRTHMYMFITEERRTKAHIDQATWPDMFADLMRRFSDPLVQSLIAHAHDKTANIDYRPLANLLVPAPWNRGRVVMIGDTMAATTPHLASGAGMGIESGIVLAEALAGHDSLQAALDSFHARRWERCRMVIQNSERICRIEIEGGDKQESARIMAESMQALAQPI